MVHIYFLASQKLQKQLIKEGQDASRIQNINFEAENLLDFATVTPAGIAVINLTDLSEYNFDKETNAGRVPPIFQKNWEVGEKHSGYFNGSVSYSEAYIREYETTFKFDEIPTAEKLIEILNQTPPDLSSKLKEKQKELDEDFEKRKEEHFIQIEKNNVKREKEKKERKLKEAKEQKIRQQTETWINEFGSDRLKLMLKNEYEFQKTYEIERGKKELPNAEIDSDNEKFDWNERGNPSLEALQQLEQLQKKYEYVKIVWVKSENDLTAEEQYYNEEYFEPYEAIIIKPNWSRYNFVQPV